MKLTLTFILLFSTQLGFAKDFLKKEQKTIVLKEIDMICADTWCSGDYNFQFKSIQCDDTKAICQINYEMYIWEQEAAKLSLNCQIRPLKKFSDLVVKQGEHYYLQDKFYDKLTDCFQNNIRIYGSQLFD
jgi:hypothetical protein